MIDHQSAVVLGAQADALDGVQDWRDLERWADTMVAIVEHHGGRGGCPIGTLAAALADTDEQFRVALNDAFDDCARRSAERSRGCVTAAYWPPTQTSNS